MTASTTTKTRRPAAKRAPVEAADGGPVEHLGDVEPLGGDLDHDAGGDALEGVVVSPDLVFVTPKKDRAAQSVAERSIPFSIDGQVYVIVRPAKLQEAIAGLIESGARRATEADVLYAGATFLRKVLAPESLARLQARLDDDADEFEITDLFDNLERIALALIKSAPAQGNRGPVPARQRVGR